ncbi:MAG TPA: LytTR family DNA-binding domain-containing protein [Solirubrobacteraceae bacterium]|jgi:DNA-binding LytR/AlgR family response regulator|nr:LytTR family DNA-binding domain-containing protein [Solirubrobacteraceae bacterium]
MTLSVLAVDDERPALEDLERVLHSCTSVGEVVTARSGGEALRRLAERRFDALFLDVRMPDLDGIELASVLERFAAPPAVVFVSAYDDAAVSAFEVHALDYLMKPVSRRRIEEALARVGDRREGGAEALADEIVAVEPARGRATHLVHRSSILYVQAQGDYVRIHTPHGRFLRRGTLGDIERRWAAHGFARVHRTYVVNLHRAVEIRPELGGTALIVLADGTSIPVARRQVAELRRRLGM